MPEMFAREFQYHPHQLLQDTAIIAGRRNLDVALGAMIVLKRRDKRAEAQHLNDEPMLDYVLSQFSSDDQQFFKERLARYA